MVFFYSVKIKTVVGVFVRICTFLCESRKIDECLRNNNKVYIDGSIFSYYIYIWKLVRVIFFLLHSPFLYVRVHAK